MFLVFACKYHLQGWPTKSLCFSMVIHISDVVFWIDISVCVFIVGSWCVSKEKNIKTKSSHSNNEQQIPGTENGSSKSNDK